MLTFIYLAYSMMALLYETVPNFEDTEVKCLGDLGRYEFPHDHKVEQKEFLQTQRSLPDDWKLRSLLWNHDSFLYP
ncbi:hypothetical protein J7T55_000164 [Diaporthe amygdali]|uniref:uncharacterized protein n=1 Tax=Phomopsis amygdali TaxID=1214568 RepID=UPI0022FE65FA|nr:uncharacterized protein J7T55_000164 [Diaporthe amygdali]KAJ0108199.1 hypothetical protein J7T55_000164 [Diaporthe amygdali]